MRIHNPPTVTTNFLQYVDFGFFNCAFFEPIALSASFQFDKDPVKLLFKVVWRIRDVYPGSRILIFTHPGSRVPDLGSKNSNKREG